MSSIYGLREQKWPGVLQGPITAVGSTITVPDATGFHPKQIVTFMLGGQAQDYEVKAILSTTSFSVGPVGKGIGILSNASMWNGGIVQAIQQNRTSISSEAVFPAVYAEEPTVAFRNNLVDYWGDQYTPANTFPVNVIPLTQIPFTLGALTFPTLVQTFLQGLNYDQVTSDTEGNEETLTFYAGGIEVTTITLDKTPTGWNLSLGGLEEDFLLLEDGDIFELEDGSGGILLEA